MRRGERGAALLLVILLVALLAVLVVEFQREARVETRAAENLHDDLQCHALLRSGVVLAEQVLAVYAARSQRDLELARATGVPGANLLWGFLFEGEALEVPVLSATIVGEAGFKAKLDDLWGRFPLGALVGDNTEPRRTLFRYYLGAAKEYLGSLGNESLANADTDELADLLLEQLDAAGAEGPPGSLLELEVGDALAARALSALTPYLDARAEWKFSANGRCIPLIMTMQGKTVEEAREIADALRGDPVQDEGEIPNRQEFGNLDPEFANSLAIKSRRFQVILEATVRGGARRARAVFGRPDPAGGAADGRFRVEEWVEGWVEGLDEPPAPAGGEEEVK